MAITTLRAAASLKSTVDALSEVELCRDVSQVILHLLSRKEDGYLIQIYLVFLTSFRTIQGVPPKSYR